MTDTHKEKQRQRGRYTQKEKDRDRSKVRNTDIHMEGRREAHTLNKRQPERYKDNFRHRERKRQTDMKKG